MNLNATNSTTLTATTATSGTQSAIRSVWCYSATNCLLGGDAGTLMTATIASGRATATSLGVTGIPNGAALYAVRCITSTFCMAFGTNGLILADNKTQAVGTPSSGAGWKVITGPQSTKDLRGVACPAANLCIAVGSSGAVEISNSLSTVALGTSWATVQSPVNYTLNGIRCSSPTSCTAVGTGHLVQITRTATGTTPQSFTIRQVG